MAAEYFVAEKSIVRTIWGKANTIFVIFAGAAAEFALNKAVDWLYYTGKLPADPLGRLFSTVAYARTIVFSEKEAAYSAIDSIAAIHSVVEAKRGAAIPDWAYRDVLFMLVDYSIRAFEMLERELSPEERQEVFDVFYRMGSRMGLKGLPESFKAWETMRAQHLADNLKYSHFTKDLFRQYRRHLGIVRYNMLLVLQAVVVPPKVRELLSLRKMLLFAVVPPLYKLARRVYADRLLKAIILPRKYKNEIAALEGVNQ